MANTIRSAIGGLAMLASTTLASTNEVSSVTNAPYFTKIEYVAPDATYTNGSFRIAGVIKAGDTNRYDVLCSSDLSNSNSWTVSNMNTNLGVKAVYDERGLNSPFSGREPVIGSKRHFKLKSRGN